LLRFGQPEGDRPKANRITNGRDQDDRADPGLADEPLKVRGLEVGDSDGPDDSLLQHLDHPAPGLDVLPQTRVGPVNQEQVDVVEAETLGAVGQMLAALPRTRAISGSASS
jgi:hypothetical protein